VPKRRQGRSEGFRAWREALEVVLALLQVGLTVAQLVAPTAGQAR
jgi:hypothetical protein